MFPDHLLAPTMRLLTATAIVACAAAAGVLSLGQGSGEPARGSSIESVPVDEIAWRKSVPVGLPHRGALVQGIQLPPEGTHFFTWDPVLEITPNRDWRRWAADTTVRKLLEVIAAYRAENPGAPRVGIGDLSRPQGGGFGRRFGGLGHASHQNGLDVDLYYPRDDGLELAPVTAAEINRDLSRDLVRRFVAAGAVYVFVGPRTKLLTGPKRIVQKLIHHDDHMHVRFPGAGPREGATRELKRGRTG